MFINIILKNTDNTINISYEGITEEIAVNDNYIAYWEENEIVVKRKDGTIVVSFDPNQEKIAPDQITLGEKRCYFMERDYKEAENLWG